MCKYKVRLLPTPSIIIWRPKLVSYATPPHWSPNEGFASSAVGCWLTHMGLNSQPRFCHSMIPKSTSCVDFRIVRWSVLSFPIYAYMVAASSALPRQLHGVQALSFITHGGCVCFGRAIEFCVSEGSHRFHKICRFKDSPVIEWFRSLTTST